MPRAYCFRCKGMREMANAVEYTMRDGKPGVRGQCRVCGRNMARRGPLLPEQQNEGETSSPPSN